MIKYDLTLAKVYFVVNINIPKKENKMICEICGQKGHHRHHIQSKSKGGTNDKWNIACLCASHHMEVHEGNIILEGKFQTTTGYQLIYHIKGEESITCREPDVYLFKSK